MVSCKGGQDAANRLPRPENARLPRLNDLLTMAALGWRRKPERIGAIQVRGLAASRMFRSEQYGCPCIVPPPLVPARYPTDLRAVGLAGIRARRGSLYI